MVGSCGVGGGGGSRGVQAEGVSCGGGVVVYVGRVAHLGDLFKWGWRVDSGGAGWL